MLNLAQQEESDDLEDPTPTKKSKRKNTSADSDPVAPQDVPADRRQGKKRVAPVDDVEDDTKVRSTQEPTVQRSL